MSNIEQRVAGLANSSEMLVYATNVTEPLLRSSQIRLCVDGVHDVVLAERAVVPLWRIDSKYSTAVRSLCFHKGVLYDAGGQGVVYETLSGTERGRVPLRNPVREVHILGCGTSKGEFLYATCTGIFRVADDNLIAQAYSLRSVWFEGDVFYCDGGCILRGPQREVIALFDHHEAPMALYVQGKDVFYASNKSIRRMRDRMITRRILAYAHGGFHREGVIGHPLTRLVSTLVAERNGEIYAMCQFQGRLIDAGEYGIKETGSGQDLVSGVPVSAVCTVPGSFVRRWLGQGQEMREE